MRPGVRNCPGRGPGRGHTAEGGTANGSREVAGAIAKHWKSRSRAQHTCKCKQQVLRVVPLGPEPGRTLLQTQRPYLASGVKPSRAAEPGSRGWTFSHNAQNSCLRKAGGGTPRGNSDTWTPLTFLSTTPLIAASYLVLAACSRLEPLSGQGPTYFDLLWALNMMRLPGAPNVFVNQARASFCSVPPLTLHPLLIPLPL